jgi:hypothetical protein
MVPADALVVVLCDLALLERVIVTDGVDDDDDVGVDDLHLVVVAEHQVQVDGVCKPLGVALLQ